MIEREREKWISIKHESESEKCPKCREKSKETVMPFGGDFFFCCNPICGVIRFSSVGYYEKTTEPLGTPKVQEIIPEMIRKRSVN